MRKSFFKERVWEGFQSTRPPKPLPSATGRQSSATGELGGGRFRRPGDFAGRSESAPVKGLGDAAGAGRAPGDACGLTA